ncbi:flagellar export chaperone FlgN [Vibrio rotiferianus]|uniref:flagellar export chaperone FlgN n=1 Tax=Vibrio rotiferianus TaxID=190895 RepID=UPI0015F3BFA4|nr:flagellar export chaperone FlgN [Vibrio rotiferianus]
MASPTSQLIQTFVKTIAVDIKLYQELLRLLQEQASIYLTFDSEALNCNIAKQMPILNQLGTHATERSLCMRKLHLPTNEQSVQRIFNALPAKLNVQARAQWNTLEGLINQCQTFNQRNGQSSAAFHELMSQLKHPVQHTYEEHTF